MTSGTHTIEVWTSSSANAEEEISMAPCTCAVCKHHLDDDSCFYCGCCCHGTGLAMSHVLADQSLLAILSKGQPTSEIEGIRFFQKRAREFLGGEDIVQRLGEFYFYQALSSQAPKAATKKNALAKQLARDLRNYLFLSCYGEARHVFDLPKVKSMSISSFRNLPSTVHSVLVSLNLKPNLLSSQFQPLGHREAVYSIGFSALEAYEGGMFSLLPMLEAIHILFSDLPWGKHPSYGGEKWANIALEGCRFLEGGMTDTIFIDHIVDIVHNGGWAFSKYYSGAHICALHQTPIQKLLDLKREIRTPEELLAYVCIPGHSVPPIAQGHSAIALRLRNLKGEP